MPLNVVSTPIGNPDDISLRAIKVLEEVEVLIGEELKVTRRFIADLSVHFSDPQKKMKQIERLNEHSTDSDLKELVEICKKQNVALISDCGTPGFCDPGSNLVSLCRQQNVKINILPGASSLMTFLSGCGHRIDQFEFIGFLPSKAEEREKELLRLAKKHAKKNYLKNAGALQKGNAIIVMDTPYRLSRTLDDVQKHFPSNTLCLGTELTKPNEEFASGSAMQLAKKYNNQKLEFILAIF